MDFAICERIYLKCKKEKVGSTHSGLGKQLPKHTEAIVTIAWCICSSEVVQQSLDKTTVIHFEGRYVALKNYIS